MPDAKAQRKRARIVIDARIMGQRGGGLVTYARELCAALAAAPSEFALVALRERGAASASDDGLAWRRAWTPPHHRWEHLALGLEASLQRPALIHALDFVPPFARRCPAVMTVHDVGFLFWPEIHDRDGRSHYGQIHQALGNADRIIAVSEATRRDLRDYLGVAPARVTVVPEAAGPIFRPIPATERAELSRAARARPGVTDLVLGHRGPYLLTVGTVEPRKNLPMLLRAYDRLVATWPAAPRLVIAGRRGWLAEETFAALGRLTARERVDWIEGPSTAELALLYATALALVFPSRYEGVGLPALEAMASGVPVLAADTSGLREHVADAGWLLPVDSEAAWTDAMRRIATDDAARADLMAAGTRRARLYSWTTTAQRTLDVYRQALDHA